MAGKIVENSILGGEPLGGAFGEVPIWGGAPFGPVARFSNRFRIFVEILQKMTRFARHFLQNFNENPKTVRKTR